MRHSRRLLDLRAESVALDPEIKVNRLAVGVVAAVLAAIAAAVLVLW